MLNYYIDIYAKLDLIDKPDLLHSMILMQVLKIDKEWERFLGFAKWWGVDNFRQDHLWKKVGNDYRYGENWKLKNPIFNS